MRARKIWCVSEVLCARARPTGIGRAICPGLFCKKGVFRNFAKFRGKHLCQSLFFNKVAGLRPAATLLKKKLWYRCFPVNFTKFLRTPFLTEDLRWLLLFMLIKTFRTSYVCMEERAVVGDMRVKKEKGLDWVGRCCMKKRKMVIIKGIFQIKYSGGFSPLVLCCA